MCFGEGGRAGWPAEPFGVGGVGGVEDGLAGAADGVGLAERTSAGVEADARVPVVVVVVVVLEEGVDEGSGGG